MDSEGVTPKLFGEQMTKSPPLIYKYMKKGNLEEGTILDPDEFLFEPRLIREVLTREEAEERYGKVVGSKGTNLKSHS